MQNSGKLLILAMLTVGLIAAGASWWFRYSATHRAAQFWGEEGARLIRDAPYVELITPADTDELAQSDSPLESRNLAGKFDIERRDISQARGLTHLRNALLEDRSYRWPSHVDETLEDWKWLLQFRQTKSAPPVSICVSPDCRWMMMLRDGDQLPGVLSCEPIADGLTTMFAELSKDTSPIR